MSRLEVYIGSDMNGAPDPTKYPTNPNTKFYPKNAPEIKSEFMSPP